MTTNVKLRFKFWDESKPLPVNPVPYSVFVIQDGANYNLFPVDKNGAYLTPNTIFPNADQVDDSTAVNKFVTQLILDKINSVEEDATQNDTDSNLRERITHTGVQEISTVNGLQGELDSKATASQGSLAGTALQPNDNISDLINDSGYITDYTVIETDVTQHQGALSVTESQISDLNHFNPSTLLTDYSFTDDSIDWNNAFNNRIISLTTNGTSGAATLSSNILNIPNYIGGTTNPAGINEYIQFNDNGSFGADSNLKWDNTNKRLGIKVATPTADLDVSGVATWSRSSSTGNPILRIKDTGTANARITASIETASNAAGFRLKTASDYWDWFLGSSGEMRFDSNGNTSKLTIKANAAEYSIYADNIGVGIGTNSPTEKLQVNGNIKTNGFFIGDGSQLTNLPLTTIDNRVIVKQASDLSGILDSTKIYIIDGVINMGSIEIIVPEGGLFLQGLDYFVSGLTSTVDNHIMFKNGVGAYAGNFKCTSLFITSSGISSKVFDLDNQQNLGAIEFNSVNLGDFSDTTTSLGELTSFRQFRTNDCGLFRNQDGLTFSGTWSGGFRINDTIVLAQAANSTLFKVGTSLTFAGRCISDINAASVDPTTITFDFVPANFLLDGGFQLTGASFAPNSSISVTTDETSIKSQFTDNVEIRNTHVRAMITSTTAVINTLDEDVEEKVEGATTITYATWMSMPVNNRITIDTNQIIDVEVSYRCRIDAGPNDEIAVSIYYWDDSASTFTQVVREVRNVSNVLGGLDVVDFDIEGIVPSVTIGDYFEPRIENTTDGTDATVQIGAKLKVVRI